MKQLCKICKKPFNLTFPNNGRGQILDCETYKPLSTYNIIGFLYSDKVNSKPYKEIGRIRCPFCGNFFDVEFSIFDRNDDERMKTISLSKDEPQRKDVIEMRLDSIDRSLAELVKVVKNLEENIEEQRRHK